MSSKQTYRPRQPLLQRFSEAWLHADVVAAVRAGSDADLNEVVTEVHPRLFELRLFSSELPVCTVMGPPSGLDLQLHGTT